MALITTDVLKTDWLNIPISDTSRDATLARWTAQAEALCKGICKQPIAQEAKTIEFQCQNGLRYNTGYTVPITLTSLSYREYPTDSWTALTGAVIDRFSVYHEDGFTYPQYKLVANIGYTISDVPADIQLAIAMLVVSAYKKSETQDRAGSIGVSSVSTSRSGETTVTVSMKDITPEIKQILQPYKVMFF